MPNFNEISVGRNPQCNICIGSECMYASGLHANIYMEGKDLVYQDVSRNGTVINGIPVHQTCYNIKYGDKIMIAGRYLLPWNTILMHFPEADPAFQDKNRRTGSEYVQNSGTACISATENSALQNEQSPNLGWNWGAFMLYPLWGFWNGCWWGILVAFFFAWTGIIPNILFGAMGSKWAWNNKSWKSAKDFNEMQEAWKPWGIAIFVINILAVVFCMIFYSALIMALISNL